MDDELNQQWEELKGLDRATLDKVVLMLLEEREKLAEYIKLVHEWIYEYVTLDDFLYEKRDQGDLAQEVTEILNRLVYKDDNSPNYSPEDLALRNALRTSFAKAATSLPEVYGTSETPDILETLQRYDEIAQDNEGHDGEG